MRMSKIALGSYRLYVFHDFEPNSHGIQIGLMNTRTASYWDTRFFGNRLINWAHRMKRRAVYHVPRILTALNPLPVYFMIDSRDCDHVRVISAHRAGCGLAYLAELDAVYRWAEGPTHVWRISRKAYREHYTETRDYIAEAHEDGHQHSVSY
jgi:hypothetical protein